MDVPSYPRSQKSNIAASRAASLSKLIGRPVFPFVVFMIFLTTLIIDSKIVHPMRSTDICNKCSGCTRTDHARLKSGVMGILTRINFRGESAQRVCSAITDGAGHHEGSNYGKA